MEINHKSLFDVFSNYIFKLRSIDQVSITPVEDSDLPELIIKGSHGHGDGEFEFNTVIPKDTVDLVKFVSEELIRKNAVPLETHYNDPYSSYLPPLGSKVVIVVQGVELTVIRSETPVQDKYKDHLHYELVGGGFIEGRFKWRHL